MDLKIYSKQVPQTCTNTSFKKMLNQNYLGEGLQNLHMVTLLPIAARTNRATGI